MKYTIKMDKGGYNRPIGRFENGRVVYDHEYHDIDVMDITMHEKIKNQDEMRAVATELYPDIVRALGDNEYIGIRMQLEKMIKMVVSKGQSLEQVQRAFLRDYGAMRMDIDIFGHKPDANAPKGM